MLEDASETSLAGIRLLLGILKESSDALPPLKATIGGLLALIDIYEVCGGVHVYLNKHRLISYSKRSRIALNCGNTSTALTN